MRKLSKKEVMVIANITAQGITEELVSAPEQLDLRHYTRREQLRRRYATKGRLVIDAFVFGRAKYDAAFLSAGFRRLDASPAVALDLDPNDVEVYVAEVGTSYFRPKAIERPKAELVAYVVETQDGIEEANGNTFYDRASASIVGKRDAFVEYLRDMAVLGRNCLDDPPLSLPQTQGIEGELCLPLV